MQFLKLYCCYLESGQLWILKTKKYSWKMFGPAKIWTRRSRSKVSYACLITTNSWKLLKKHKNFGPGVLKFKFLIFFNNKWSTKLYQYIRKAWKIIVKKFFVNLLHPNQYWKHSKWKGGGDHPTLCGIGLAWKKTRCILRTLGVI